MRVPGSNVTFINISVIWLQRIFLIEETKVLKETYHKLMTNYLTNLWNFFFFHICKGPSNDFSCKCLILSAPIVIDDGHLGYLINTNFAEAYPEKNPAMFSFKCFSDF